jgi:hypothetical protein
MIRSATKTAAAARTASGSLVTTPNSRLAVNADGVKFWFMISVTDLSMIIILMWVE